MKEDIKISIMINLKFLILKQKITLQKIFAKIVAFIR